MTVFYRPCQLLPNVRHKKKKQETGKIGFVTPFIIAYMREYMCVMQC